MKTNRVLHIITRVQRGGGAERNTLYTIKGLPREKYKPFLMVGIDSDFEYAKKVSNCDIYIEKYLIRNINPFKDLMALIRIYKFIKAGDFDIVHTHLAKGGIIGRLAARLAGAPVIIHSLHGSTFHSNLNMFTNRIYIFLEKLTGRSTDCFIPVGEDLKDKYIKAGVGNPEKYFVVNSGMDLDKFYGIKDFSKEKNEELKSRFGLLADDIVVGMAASLEPRKGHKYALEAAKRLTRENSKSKFIFVGDGYLRGELEKYVKENNLSGLVKFLGYVNEMEKFFAVCDVVILTSLWEGLPQVLVQAAAGGKPIVSFDVEGAKEVVEDGVNGFIVPVKDANALVEKIKYLIADLDRAKNMGRKGESIIGDKWNVQTMINKTIDIYDRELAKKK